MANGSLGNHVQSYAGTLFYLIDCRLAINFTDGAFNAVSNMLIFIIHSFIQC